MEEKAYNKLLLETKRYYFGLNKVSCPALNNEYVHFNKHGFNHFLHKGRTPRKKKDQIRRFRLLSTVPMIISSCERIHAYKEDKRMGSVAYFCEIRGKYKNKIVKIIIRKLNNGRLHFFSVMSKKQKAHDFS